MEKVFNIDFYHYNSLDELNSDDRELITQAKAMTSKSFAPYSSFCVGAAARLRSGKIIHGCNVESEVYPAGLCAERTLLFYAQSNHGDDPIEAMAIASVPDEREVYPCGQCRQVMVDTERRQDSPMRVIMSGRDSATIVNCAADLLPFTFKL
ncbi:MAG: cytidine deaminase [Rikenellaceae bacterium]